MKKILFLLLFPLVSFAQQQAYVTGNYVVLVDTVSKRVSEVDLGNGMNVSSLYIRTGNVKLFDVYDGMFFAFTDTISTSDIAQQGSTGVFKITPHASRLSTTKRNVYFEGIILQYDTTAYELVTSTFSDTKYPLVIRNISTLAPYVIIYPSGKYYLKKLPTLSNISAFGSGIKKIILN